MDAVDACPMANLAANMGPSWRGWPLSGRKQPIGIVHPEERHAVLNGFIVGALIFEVHRSTELALTNARHAVLVRGMLPVAQDEIGITGAAADPELDTLGTTGVFQPVNDLHHATLPDQGRRHGRNCHRSPVNYRFIPHTRRAAHDQAPTAARLSGRERLCLT